jgi:hypothetical protein
MALLFSFVVGFPVLGDWEAHIQINSAVKGPISQGEGMMKMKGKRIRLDLTSPFSLSVIGDGKTGKASMLIHPIKIFVETSVSESELKSIPFCDGKEVDTCLTKAGYKKAGQAKVNGYTCVLYEGDLKPPQVKTATHAKVWRVEGMNEMPITRVVTKEIADPTRSTQIDFTEIKVLGLSDTIFSVPADYHLIANADQILKGLGK